jgi:hypothetical protein
VPKLVKLGKFKFSGGAANKYLTSKMLRCTIE